MSQEHRDKHYDTVFFAIRLALGYKYSLESNRKKSDKDRGIGFIPCVLWYVVLGEFEYWKLIILLPAMDTELAEKQSEWDLNMKKLYKTMSFRIVCNVDPSNKS